MRQQMLGQFDIWAEGPFISRAILDSLPHLWLVTLDLPPQSSTNNELHLNCCRLTIHFDLWLGHVLGKVAGCIITYITAFNEGLKVGVGGCFLAVHQRGAKIRTRGGVSEGEGAEEGGQG